MHIFSSTTGKTCIFGHKLSKIRVNPSKISYFQHVSGPTGHRKKTTESNLSFSGPKKPPKTSIFFTATLKTVENNRSRQKMIFFAVMQVEH
jgi:hypothetical protein